MDPPSSPRYHFRKSTCFDRHAPPALAGGQRTRGEEEKDSQISWAHRRKCGSEILIPQEKISYLNNTLNCALIMLNDVASICQDVEIPRFCVLSPTISGPYLYLSSACRRLSEPRLDLRSTSKNADHSA
jgi:hypothetical protein